MSAENWAKLNEIILAQEKLNEELQERLSKVEAGVAEPETKIAKHIEKKVKPTKKEEEEKTE